VLEYVFHFISLSLTLCFRDYVYFVYLRSRICERFLSQVLSEFYRRSQCENQWERVDLVLTLLKISSLSLSFVKSLFVIGGQGIVPTDSVVQVCASVVPSYPALFLE